MSDGTVPKAAAQPPDHSVAPWPHRTLDVPALRARGLPQVPFRQFVLKVNSRCNLNCAYCYVYNAADSSWRDRPTRLEETVLRQVVHRIAEHVRTHRLTDIRVELHGGEPLLSGPAFLPYCVGLIRDAVGEASAGRCAVRASVQTNATVLTEPMIGELADSGIRIGVSLDGGTPATNARRVDHQGRPSWPRAAQGLALLSRHPAGYAGILSTIDIGQDPVETYTSLLQFAPASLDFLLPHANWSHPPPGHDGRSTPYGDWLAAVFDRWFDADRFETSIRLFSEIIALLLGLRSATEAVGTSPVATVVVDTDGAVEQVDSLKSAYHGAPATGLDVFRHSFDDALDLPGFVARQLGTAALSEKCRSCPVQRVCGGGNYAHRYRAGRGFDQPSVYCADLERIIRHIAARLATALPDGV
ncbi:FxsB family cyclophane-forming radical SAM/SPASM peptide maturase [Streptomyces mangrovisoli]|uniref:FxsB family radical SAM/SPASM domain protein n=1 Tax=Streptomyces mangrovisoli TaxID=1428628 RepID=A0A1J4NR12_9ACTN|nr:FxsB family cyclophane-forming radical SAM/SPASM peptide maturase [Streptomyces mangrovisoli]OIJ63590.1 FxsB family radical SAM/SPASM domain protein [Streptomyces mangrovisoli]